MVRQSSRPVLRKVKVRRVTDGKVKAGTKAVKATEAKMEQKGKRLYADTFETQRNGVNVRKVRRIARFTTRRSFSMPTENGSEKAKVKAEVVEPVSNSRKRMLDPEREQVPTIGALPPG